MLKKYISRITCDSLTLFLKLPCHRDEHTYEQKNENLVCAQFPIYKPIVMKDGFCLINGHTFVIQIYHY